MHYKLACTITDRSWGIMNFHRDQYELLIICVPAMLWIVLNCDAFELSALIHTASMEDLLVALQLALL